MIHPVARGIESKITDYVTQNVKDLRDGRQLRERIWMDCLEAYLSTFNAAWRAKARYENRSARFVALPWDAVENLTAQLIAMIMPSEDWFHVEPGRWGGFKTIDETMAPRVKQFHLFQHEHMKFKEEVRKLVKWMVITGNATFMMDWHKEAAVDYPAYAKAQSEWIYRQQIMFQQFQAQMTQWAIDSRLSQMQGLPPPPQPAAPFEDQPEPATDTIYEGPRLVVGDPFNFVIDDRANDPMTAFRATTRWRTKAYIAHQAEVDRTGYAVYENLDQVKDSKQHGQDDKGRNVAIAYAFGMSPVSKDAVELVEAVGDFELPVDDSTSERNLLRNWVAVVANEKTLLRFEPCHLWSREPHLRLATLIPCPGQVYGIGLLENALGLADSVNVRHNQVIDAIAVGINPEKKVIDDGVIDIDNMESGAGAVTLVGSLDNIQPIIHNLQNLPLAFNEIASYQALFEQMTRSANPARSQGGNESATKIARDTAIYGGGMQEIARFIEDTAIQPILRMQLQYNQQYINEEIAIRVTQDQDTSWVSVSPADIRLGWSFKVVGSQNRMERDKRIQDLMMFLQIVTGNPMLIPMIKTPYLLKRVYEELGFVDGERVFLSEKEVQMAQMQAQMAAQGGPDGTGMENGAPEGGGQPGAGLPPGGVGDSAPVPQGVRELTPYVEAAAAGRRSVAV